MNPDDFKNLCQHLDLVRKNKELIEKEVVNYFKEVVYQTLASKETSLPHNRDEAYIFANLTTLFAPKMYSCMQYSRSIVNANQRQDQEERGISLQDAISSIMHFNSEDSAITNYPILKNATDIQTIFGKGLFGLTQDELNSKPMEYVARVDKLITNISDNIHAKNQTIDSLSEKIATEFKRRIKLTGNNQTEIQEQLTKAITEGVKRGFDTLCPTQINITSNSHTIENIVNILIDNIIDVKGENVKIEEKQSKNIAKTIYNFFAALGAVLSNTFIKLDENNKQPWNDFWNNNKTLIIDAAKLGSDAEALGKIGEKLRETADKLEGKVKKSPKTNSWITEVSVKKGPGSLER